MKVPNTKFEKCAATKADVRYYLREPWLDVDGKRLLATDGHVLAVIPVEVDDDDTTGTVPMDAVKAVRKVSKKGGELLLETAHANAYGVRYPREECKYPDVDRILEPANNGKGTPDIVVDAKLLYDLAQALIECKTTEPALVRLYFKRDDDSGLVDKKSAIRVEPMGPNAVAGAFGIIMPCRDTDD